MSFATKVFNMRRGPYGSVLAFFDVAFGDFEDGVFTGVMTGKGFALKQKRDGGYWYQAPSKPRLDRDKQPVMKDGYPVYDEHIMLFMAKGDSDKWEVTPAAWEGRKAIVEQATALYDRGEGNAGRGSREGTRKDTGDKEVDAPFPDDDDDDELPF